MEITGSLFLSLNFESGALPSSLELIPAGTLIRGRDGREWKKSDPKKIVLNSAARLSKLVIDENHATDLSAPKGGASPAMGWMTNLRTGAGGSIRADVEWTKRGGEAVLNKEYSFISPVFLHDDRGEITVVLRAALTNSPNLNLPALNSERLDKTITEVRMNKELLAALGLGETATEAEALAAVKALNAAKPQAKLQTDASAVDLAAYAPRADLNAMETRALAAEKQLAELNAAALLRDAEAAVEDAIKNRKIAPASREEYLALCATQAGLESFKKIMTASPAIIGAETQAPEGTPPDAGNSAVLNAEETALAKALGYTAEEFQKIKEGKK
ncbi:MAG: phage protease [Spirochaetaceae bacterium]|jgi:phage I-like protein|nr:phage protease [Spirochaetaceae bacterium]